MFEKVKIPVMGVVENMSMHICSACGHQEAIFGEGGGELLSQDYQVPLLGKLPLDRQIRAALDKGTPSLVESPNSAISETYRQIAREMASRLSYLSKDYAKGSETIAVSNWSPNS
jgi:ATP-binding protein involved in chromosome partitioning